MNLERGYYYPLVTKINKAKRKRISHTIILNLKKEIKRNRESSSSSDLLGSFFILDATEIVDPASMKS